MTISASGIKTAASGPARRTAAMPREHSSRSDLIPPALARIPIHFFTLAVFSLAATGVAAVAMLPPAVQLFYQPRVLALVHTLTLGVITAAIMGVMYRYVPALRHRPIKMPAAVRVQLILFVIGAAGMITHFALSDWVGLWWSAAAVLISLVLFALCLLPVLWDGVGSEAAETGMFFAICFLLCAGALGLTMGLEEVYGFKWADLPRMLGTHIVFAAIGWVSLTICAVSYRLLPAFLLPTVALPAAALWQICALSLAVAGLGLSLLFGFAGAALWAGAVCLSMIAYLLILTRLLRTRRMKLGWGLRHAQAGGVWLLLTIALGIAIAWQGAWSREGARWAAGFAAAGLLGWMVNFIIGMSYQLFPGFISRARTALGWPAIVAAQLSVPRIQPFVFVLYNVSVAVIVIAFLAKQPELARWGAVLLAGTTVVYAGATLSRLVFAYRKSPPRLPGWAQP